MAKRCPHCGVIIIVPTWKFCQSNKCYLLRKKTAKYMAFKRKNRGKKLSTGKLKNP